MDDEPERILLVNLGTLGQLNLVESIGRPFNLLREVRVALTKV
jgi:hypothetical protein